MHNAWSNIEMSKRVSKSMVHAALYCLDKFCFCGGGNGVVEFVFTSAFQLLSFSIFRVYVQSYFVRTETAAGPKLGI